MALTHKLKYKNLIILFFKNLARNWKPNIKILRILLFFSLTCGDWKPRKSLHFLFFIKTFRFFGEISPMKNRLPARRSSRSLSLSHGRSSAAADGRTSCLQRTRSALSSPFITRYRWSHIMFSTDTIVSHRRWPPATDGRTFCFQRTRSASAAVGVDYMDRSVSIAGAHCTVSFFWIGVLKTVFPLAACARPVLRMAMALNLLGQEQQIGSSKPNHAHCSCRKIHQVFFSAHIKLWN